mmetsp:Transcript_31779/g.91540  ORF Transcript_31779/g.91540 Transcript_31779/m.91540 type:complete len:218 (+) Transcript_31779:469-1122(+)
MMMGKPEPRILFSESLSLDAAQQVLAFCRRVGWCASYCRASGPACAAPETPEQEGLLSRFESLEGTKQVRVADLGEVLTSGELPLKIVAMVDDPEAAAASAKEALPSDLVHIIAAEMHVEFLNPSVNKGRSLARLCNDVVRVPLAEVVAYGDNHNDVEMLRLVGDGVAMANAKDAVKSAADRECRWSNDEEGVANDINALLDAGVFSTGAVGDGSRL